MLRPDVVHTHSSKAGIIGRFAAHAAGVPLIVHTIHGLAFTASKSRLVNKAYELAERAAAPKCDVIVCVADAMREQSLAADIGRAEQYVTVYSGMDVEPFINPPVPREQTRASLGIAPEHVVVGTIARLFHMKGHDDLLELAPVLCREFPQLRFMWVGDGLLRETFEQQMTEMGLRDRFILTGLVPPQRVPELTAAMDVLVHPSRREGLARALPQGQLAGCPVITYDVDGNREGLIDGESGFLLPPFDRIKLAESLRVLLSDPVRRVAMGTRGREFARSRFATQVMLDELQKVYETGLARKVRR
jgi:glycosyltransferase involved in cell wall biosynthesis